MGHKLQNFYAFIWIYYILYEIKKFEAYFTAWTYVTNLIV